MSRLHRTLLAAALLLGVMASSVAAAELRVVGPDERAVAGARVELYVEGGPTAEFAVADRPLAAAVTGDDGVAPVQVPAVDGVALLVDHPEYVPRVLEGAAAQGAVEVRLDRGEPLEGRVEPAGAEAPARAVREGGTVCAHGRFELRMGGRSREWRRCAPVAPDGTFELAGLADGPVEIEVRVPGHLPLVRTVESREPIRLAIEPGVPVTGRVADRHGWPIAGTEVEADGAVPDETGPDGRFAVAVARLPAELKVRALGFRERVHRVTEQGDLELRLEPTEQIVATLLGEPGFPIAEVEVSFRDVTPDSRLAGRVTLAPDEEGEIRLDLPGPGRYRLYLLVRGYRDRVHPPVEVGAGRSVPLGAIQLSRGAGVRGVLLDTDRGTPLVGVVVEALPVGGLGLGVLADGRGGQGEVSDESGAFTLAGLDIGRYHLSSRHDRYATVHRLVDLEREGVLDLGTLYLDGGVTLHGRLTGRDGEARPGLTLRLFDAANEVLVPLAEATSDAAGAYRFEPIGPGRYRLQVVGQPQTPTQRISVQLLLLAQEIEIVPGSAGQRLDLEVGGVTVHGRLTYRGLPVAAGRVTLAPVLERRPRVAPIQVRSGDRMLAFGRPAGAVLGEVAEDGSFTLDDVPPGLAWLAYGDLSGERRFLRRLSVPDRAESTVEIELEGPPLEGSVVDASTGLPLPADVSLYTVTGLPFERVRTDPDGRFRFDDLEDGGYELEAAAEGHVPIYRAIELSDASLHLGIDLEPSGEAGRLEAVLRHPDGTPASTVPPFVVDAAGRRSLLGRPGGDQVADLPAGHYRIAWADALYGAGVSDPVRVDPGGRELVDHVLGSGASVVVACPIQRCANAPVELLTVHAAGGVELTPLLAGVMPALRFSAAGDLSIGRLSPGEYVFTLWVDGEQWESEAEISTREARVRLP